MDGGGSEESDIAAHKPRDLVLGSCRVLFADPSTVFGPLSQISRARVPFSGDRNFKITCVGAIGVLANNKYF